MRKYSRALALACALTLTPACAAFEAAAPRFENPVSAARTIDQRAFALLNTYAAVIEEATDIVRDPSAPLAFKRALGQAEAVATPSAETLNIAVTAYLRAQADFDAAAREGQTPVERASAALAIAARRLAEATSAAQAPIAELEDLVRARRG
ncbi:hypothetical protein U91I_02539 [alpha proteobacterium U9-1i]|nr:hypothetical protein U91I_02539 [alpha proteobacterium U9-1i]